MSEGLSVEDFAKYPFLKEAGEAVRELELGLSDLAHPDFTKVLDRARERVMEALKRARVGERFKDREAEVLSFPLALLLVKATGNEYLASRHALAEAVRIEGFLEEERADFILYIFSTVLGIVAHEVRGDAFDFRVKVTDYLNRASHFHAPAWKLVNRPVKEGYVYLRQSDLVRLIREEIRKIILERIRGIRVPSLPEPIRRAADEIKAITPTPRGLDTMLDTKPEDYPPCVQHAIQMLDKGENVPHYGRFLLATYLLNIGKSVDHVVSLFPRASDFSERITRYQVEHIAGLRGGRVKYRVPSCATMQTHNFCFKTEKCEGIMNPIHFGRRSAVKKWKKSKRPYQP